MTMLHGVKHALRVGLLFAAFALGLCPVLGQDVGSPLPSLRDFFAGAESRYPGSPGNLEIERRVAERFANSGFNHGEIRFRAPILMPGETTLRVGEASFNVQPMHPTVFRPSNFADRSFQAPLVYVGEGTSEDLAKLEGIDLEGTVGVLEFNSGEEWLSLLRFGFRGFVFLGADSYSRRECTTKLAETEARCPRFFLDGAPGDALRARLLDAENRTLAAEVESEPSRYQNRMLRDLWVFIPGSDPEHDNETFAFFAPIDANCVVPARATGAQNAANLHLLLRMLEHYAETPPKRPVLLVAVNARTLGFLGDRMLAWYTTAPTRSLATLRDIYASRAREQEVLLSYYERLEGLESADDPEKGEFVIEMRTIEDNSTGKPLVVKDPIVALAKRDVNGLKGELVRIRNAELPKAEEEARRKAVNAQLDKHVNVLTLFNKVGIQTNLSDLSEAEIGILRGYVDALCGRYRVWSEKNREDLARDKANEAVRSALPEQRLRAAIQLDLTWNTDPLGFCSLSQDLKKKSDWSTAFGANVVTIAQRIATPDSAPVLDTMTNYAGLPEKYYFPIPESAIGMFHASKVPAFAVKNPFQDGGRAFTPSDTWEELDEARVETQSATLLALFDALLADPDIALGSQLKRPPGGRLWSKFIENFKFDELSAAVSPQLPVPGSVSIVYPGAPGGAMAPAVVAGSVANRYMVLTDERATAVQYAIPQLRSATALAYQFDEDFVHVHHAIDVGAVQEKIASTLTTETTSHTLALFQCREFPVVAREDSSKLSFVPLRVNTYLPMTASQNSAPRKYGMGGIGSAFSAGASLHGVGPAAVYMRDDRALKLVTTTKRAALNADVDAPEGAGFRNPEEMDPDFFADVVHDMGFLNAYRRSKLQGVTNALVTQFRQTAEQEMEAMERAREKRDHVGYLKHLYAALGSRAKTYKQIATITNDMMKAVVFYMALLLPFCFFLTKLLFKFSRIEVELLVFGLFFVLTFLVFRLIHPAFRVAKAPEAIFIAFIMLVLGAFVLFILHSRFAGEMQLLFMTYTGMDTSEVGYSTVGQKAMLIGVNNMKRRRIRTTLTTVTIVLVTFTMLAFSSISKKMSPTVISIDEVAPYKGLFYQWPGNLRMDEATLRVLRNLFHGRAERMVVRRWMLPEKEDPDRPAAPFTVSSPTSGQRAQIHAILGMPPEDDGFLARMPLLPGESRFFSAPDAHEAILPAGAAKALGLDTSDVGSAELVFHGHRLRLVGLLDGDQLRTIRDLNAQSILPIKDIEKAGADQKQAAENLAEDDPTAKKSGVFFVDPASLLVLPERTAADLGAEPFSVSIEIPDDSNLWDEIQTLLTTTEAKFFVSSDREFQVGPDPDKTTEAGVYYIGSGYKTSIGGLSRLIIPILIAGTIILNTMLGSVYERKQEIAIYNAIGLNPTHIGFFFLAEALVYSFIGAVGGYLIGQVLTLTLDHFNIVSGLNLNFSSLSVVYVILFTIGIVLLSTLYPAMVATREAVPSGKRKWSLPEHQDGLMDIEFPFIYQPSLVQGVMGYLQDHFSRFSEASVGEMIVHLEGTEHEADENGRDVYTLTYNIALAPFDLGVTQRARFRAAYSEHVQSYRITLHIERLSGQDTNWTTTNKPFLEKLRQHMMHWRNLSPESQALYKEQGADLFREETPSS